MKFSLCLFVAFVLVEHSYSFNLFNPFNNNNSNGEKGNFCLKHISAVQDLIDNGVKFTTMKEIRKTMLKCFLQAAHGSLPQNDTDTESSPGNGAAPMRPTFVFLNHKPFHKPSTTTAKPATAKPVAATVKPVAATAKPVAATAKPVAATAKPVAAKPAKPNNSAQICMCTPVKEDTIVPSLPDELTIYEHEILNEENADDILESVTAPSTFDFEKKSEDSNTNKID